MEEWGREGKGREGVKVTHTRPEVRGVQLRVVLVLHGVVDAVALPHEVVMSAQDGGVHFGHVLENEKEKDSL